MWGFTSLTSCVDTLRITALCYLIKHHAGTQMGTGFSWLLLAQVWGKQTDRNGKSWAPAEHPSMATLRFRPVELYLWTSSSNMEVLLAFWFCFSKIFLCSTGKENPCKKLLFILHFMPLLWRITIFPYVVTPYYYLQCTTNRTKEFLPNTGRCGNKGFCYHQNGRERTSQKLGIWKILIQCLLYRPHIVVYDNIGYPTDFFDCSGKICCVFLSFCSWSLSMVL